MHRLAPPEFSSAAAPCHSSVAPTLSPFSDHLHSGFFASRILYSSAERCTSRTRTRERSHRRPGCMSVLSLLGRGRPPSSPSPHRLLRFLGELTTYKQVLTDALSAEMVICHYLKREEEKELIRRKIRAHASDTGSYTGTKPATASHSFPIELEKLTTLNRDHDSLVLQEIGGVEGLSSLLKSYLDKGINPSEDELLQRRDVSGANTYPRKKRKTYCIKFRW